MVRVYLASSETLKQILQHLLHLLYKLQRVATANGCGVQDATEGEQYKRKNCNYYAGIMHSRYDRKFMKYFRYKLCRANSLEKRKNNVKSVIFALVQLRIKGKLLRKFLLKRCNSFI